MSAHITPDNYRYLISGGGNRKIRAEYLGDGPDSTFGVNAANRWRSNSTDKQLRNIVEDYFRGRDQKNSK